MFYKLTLACVFALACAGAMAAEKEECGAAVDEADKLAAGIDKNCDYKNTGLNGVLHRAIAGKKKSGENVEDSKANNENETVSTPVEKNKKPAEKADELAPGEFKSPQQLSQVKFALMEKLVLECSKGFVVEGERYLPVKNSKAMKLELIYHCL